MLRQTLQLLVVVFSVAFASGVGAQEDRWKVSPDARRDTEIVQRYRHLLLRNPDHAVAYRGLLSRVGRGPGLDREIAHVEKAAASRPTDAAPWVLLGHLLRERGRDPESFAAYQHAVSIDPRSALAHAALGAALERSGNQAAADASYERALKLAATDAARRELLRRLADVAMARGDHGRAVDWLEALVAVRPRDHGLRVELAETQLRAHRFDAALESYRATLALAGRSGKHRAQAWRDIGHVHRQMHDLVAAEVAYRKALALIGKSSWMRREVLMQLVEVARETGSLAQMYDELIREWGTPSYHDAIVLAGISEELDRGEDAVKWLERAARLDRRALEPRTRLIARLTHPDDAARVRALYDEIVSLRPEDLGQRLERIEWLFFRAQRADEALAELARIEGELAEPFALVQVASTWRRFGVVDAALAIHARLDVSHPDDVVHLEAYGELLTRLGRDEEAEAIWTRIFAQDPDGASARLRVAEIATRLRRHEQASELLAWVVARHPRMVDARQRLATAYEARRMWTSALQQWEVLYFEDDVDHAARRIVAIANRTAFLGDEAVTPDAELLGRWEAYYDATPTVRVGLVLARLRLALGARDAGLELLKVLAARDPASLPSTEHASWLAAADLRADELEHSEPLAAIEMLERVAAAFGDRRTLSWRRIADIALRLADAEQTRRLLTAALAAVPNDATVHSVAGVYWGDVDRGVAIRHLERAVALGTRSFDVHFDLAFHLTQAGELDRARAVYLSVMRSDGSGNYAAEAAFSAIDLCDSDADLLELERELDSLPGRVPKQTVFAITTAIYTALFVYADDPAAAFEAAGRRALPRLVEALQAEADDDRRRVMDLLQLYDASEVAKLAMREWPREVGAWQPEMVILLAKSGEHGAAMSLVGGITSEEPQLRRHAIFGVGLGRVEAAVEPLIAVLRQAGAPEVERVLAAAALGRIGTDRAIEALETVASDATQSATMRSAAIWGLGQSATPRAAEALVARFTDGVEARRRLASLMLGRLPGESGLRALLLAAWDEDPVRRAMGELGLRVAPATNSFWADGTHIHHLPELVGMTFEDALHASTNRPMALAFVGREKVVVEAATQTLWRGNSRVLEQLVAAVDEVSDADGREVETSLRRVVRGLRPKLRKLTRSDDSKLRVRAALLLPTGQVPDDAPLVAEVATNLAASDGARVLERLNRFPWKAVRPTLIDQMRSPNPQRRGAAAAAFGRFRDAVSDAEGLDLLRRIAHEADPVAQVPAIEAMGELRLEGDADALAELHKVAPDASRQAIRAALGKMTSAEARAAARRVAIQPTKRVCNGDQSDLSDLLRDDCVGAVDIPDF